MDGSGFVGTQVMAATLKLHAVLDAACGLAGDSRLSQHALLVGVAERDGGLSLKAAGRRFGLLGDVGCLVGSLEEREFAERTRDPRDRREFALRVTRKGLAQIERVDEVLAFELIARSRGLTEDSFGQLAERMAALSASVDPEARGASLFPSAFLCALDAYHRAVVQEAACLGLSSFQAALLAALDAFDDEEASLSYARQFGVAEDTVNLQIERLRDKGMIAGEGSFVLGGEGMVRLDALEGRMRQRIETLLSSVRDGVAGEVHDVCELVVYVLL